jgi:nucleotide-binding universal stress UspA family protein
MKQIIVPIDFSEESFNGLKLAIIFANQFKANIQMVYVQKPTNEIGRLDLQEEHKQVEIAFEKIVKEHGSKLHDPTRIEFHIKKGKIYQEVINQAEAFENSAINLSTHGASGFEELFIGSNALKIISASDIPVFTVHHGAAVRNIETIVLPIDTSIETRQKASYTALIAKAFDAEVHVLGVSSSGSNEAEHKVTAYSNQVCEYFTEHGVKHKTIKRTGKGITNTVIDYATEVRADLISIMSEKSGSLSDFVLGTNAQQILSKSPVPVLSITPKETSVKGSFSTSGG